jgi:diguanylate cyclase (GGDEF)-like protein
VEVEDSVRSYWLLAGSLFVGGGLAGIVPIALHEPEHAAAIYLLPLLAIVSGLVCWAVSRRAPRSWLHVVLVLGTVEVTLATALADHLFATYYVFVAICSAYVFIDRRMIAAHVALAALGAFAAVLYTSGEGPGEARHELIFALILIPSLVLAAGAVAFLRERLAVSEARYRELSELDPLTEVGNYRKLTTELERQLTRHRRYVHSMALIAIDLNGFKEVNDRFGHLRGDEVLREVAACMRTVVRAHDLVARQGGDEFCIVAGDLGRPGAQELAARVTASVAAIDLGDHRLGASVGIAVFPDDGETAEALLGHADAQLRRAKSEEIQLR